ncbi:MAG: hypothetical protein ABIP51_21190 [Bacteroidia bacterium]
MIKLKIIFSGIFLFAVFIGCDNKKGKLAPKEYPINCDTITFAKNVKPIIDFSCAKVGCHVAGFFPGNYTTYAGIYPNVANGKLRLRLFDSPSNPMPKDLGMLPADKLAIIKCWLDKGGPND